MLITATTKQIKQRQDITNKNNLMLGIRQILIIAKSSPKKPPVASNAISENRIKSILFLP